MTNTGGLTAQDVVITGELVIGEGEPETAEITITFLSGSEAEEGQLIFSENPNDGELKVGPTSFLSP